MYIYTHTHIHILYIVDIEQISMVQHVALSDNARILYVLHPNVDILGVNVELCVWALPNVHVNITGVAHFSFSLLIPH